MTGSVLIRGGTVVDREGERRADVLIDGGRVAAVGDAIGAEVAADQVLDAGGCVVAPGFVDLHVHLREPGREEAETIETGSRAAALGGFTAVVAMPNTDPPQDSRGVVEFVRAQGEQAGLCEVLPAGCITMGRARRSAGTVRRARRRRRTHLHRRRQRRAGPAAHASCDGVLARPGHGPRPALRGRPPHPRGRHARGPLLQRARVTRMACARRGADGPSRPRAVTTDRCPHPPAPPVDGAQRRAGPAGQGRGCRRVRRSCPSPLHAHRRAPARLRPGLQGESAAADRRRRRGDQGRSRRRHHRRDRHGPRTASPRRQGATDRQRTAGHARVGDRPRRRTGRARLAAAGCRRRAVVEAGRDRRRQRSPRRTDPGGQPRQRRRVRPDGHLERAARSARQPQPQHPVRRANTPGKVRHTVFRGAPVVVDGVPQR